MRKDAIVIDDIHHIFSKSISGFRIFNNESELLRMVEVIKYYRRKDLRYRFSYSLISKQEDIYLSEKDKLVEIIAYCIMPTHVHLVLKQLQQNGISIFMSRVLNSYTRFFNIKHNRKGPLWESKFKNVLIKNEGQLLHLIRYIHLNPVTAYLINNPEEWMASSYKEYVSKSKMGICYFENLLSINPELYRKFVEDRISYQRTLADIKKLLFE